MAITPSTPGEIQPPNSLTPDNAGSIATPNSLSSETVGAVGVPNTLTPDSVGAIDAPNSLSAESAGSIGTPNTLTSLPTPISELVTNGDFANGTDDWESRGSATLSVTSNIMEVTDSSGTAAAAATQTVNLIADRTYIVNCEARKVIGGNPELLIEWSGGGDIKSSGTTSTSFQPLSFEFTPLNTSGDNGFDYTLNLREDGSDAGDISEFKNVSVKVKTLITALPPGEISPPN